jgi:hypothetical protein
MDSESAAFYSLIAAKLGIPNDSCTQESLIAKFNERFASHEESDIQYISTLLKFHTGSSALFNKDLAEKCLHSGLLAVCESNETARNVMKNILNSESPKIVTFLTVAFLSESGATVLKSDIVNQLFRKALEIEDETPSWLHTLEIEPDKLLELIAADPSLIVIDATRDSEKIIGFISEPPSGTGESDSSPKTQIGSDDKILRIRKVKKAISVDEEIDYTDESISAECFRQKLALLGSSGTLCVMGDLLDATIDKFRIPKIVKLRNGWTGLAEFLVLNGREKSEQICFLQEYKLPSSNLVATKKAGWFKSAKKVEAPAQPEISESRKLEILQKLLSSQKGHHFNLHNIRSLRDSQDFQVKKILSKAESEAKHRSYQKLPPKNSASPQIQATSRLEVSTAFVTEEDSLIAEDHSQSFWKTAKRTAIEAAKKTAKAAKETAKIIENTINQNIYVSLDRLIVLVRDRIIVFDSDGTGGDVMVKSNHNLKELAEFAYIDERVTLKIKGKAKGKIFSFDSENVREHFVKELQKNLNRVKINVK